MKNTTTCRRFIVCNRYYSSHPKNFILLLDPFEIICDGSITNAITSITKSKADVKVYSFNLHPNFQDFIHFQYFWYEFEVEIRIFKLIAKTLKLFYFLQKYNRILLERLFTIIASVLIDKYRQISSCKRWCSRQRLHKWQRWIRWCKCPRGTHAVCQEWAHRSINSNRSINNYRNVA